MADVGGAPAGRRNDFLSLLRARARRGILIEGALPHVDAQIFVEQLRLGRVLPTPIDAERPDDADVLIVVGRIPARLAEPLAWARARLTTPATVIAFDDPRTPNVYAMQRVTEVIAVDVMVQELPPRGETLQALRPLLGRRS